MRLAVIYVLVFVLGSFFCGADAVRAQTEKSVQTDLLDEFNAADTRRNYGWAGDWVLSSRYTPKDLQIKPLGAGKFQFEINASNGANIGSVSGSARIRGDKAYFDDREAAGTGADRAGCRLLFTHKTKFIEIRETAECSYYAGNAVAFMGKYSIEKLPVPESDFVGRGVFPDAATDKKFRQLAAADYENFLDAFHLISEDEDLDALDTKVFSACVRGICPWNAAIIMFDDKMNFYAMVLVFKDDDEVLAHYYSNNAEYRQKLPRTIQNWLTEKSGSDGEIAVVFKNMSQ